MKKIISRSMILHPKLLSRYTLHSWMIPRVYFSIKVRLHGSLVRSSVSALVDKNSESEHQETITNAYVAYNRIEL